KGQVKTNQGEWKSNYVRVFRIEVPATGVLLRPVPEKNRFGVMGWPDPFLFFRSQPWPNLPGVELPTDPAEMLAYIEALEARFK
ncbi:MAG: hypothetical protein OEZ59_14250, partial [Deltaproteobacteria bacterium]|nr:hypothetical protein [Deltaproteobacteria bacterium]